MKINLLITVLILINLNVEGQGKHVDITINDSKIKPWLTEDVSDYQNSYHFSNSELESTLFLIFDNDSCYAQIRSGEWGEIDSKEIWISNFETINSVRIKGNKFYSDKTDGEFVIFEVENEQHRGLMVYEPWSTIIHFSNIKGYELGNTTGAINSNFPGIFSYASLRHLNIEELEKMSKSDLQKMRNEIYARYGYIFNSGGNMDLYFRKQSWYNGLRNNVNDLLTGLEKRNIALIQRIEQNKNGL